MKEIKRYSEAFKQRVVREIEEGQHETILGAARFYGIMGQETVQSWLKKYGKWELLKKVVRVETPREIDERQRLSKAVKGLKEEVADLHMDLKLESAFLKIACRRLGISVEEFKKKSDAKS